VEIAEHILDASAYFGGHSNWMDMSVDPHRLGCGLVLTVMWRSHHPLSIEKPPGALATGTLLTRPICSCTT